MTVAFASLALDLFAILTAGLLSYWYKFGLIDLIPAYRVALLMGLVVSAFTLNKSGLYDSWRGRDLLDQARAAAIGWGLALLTLVVIAFLTKTSATFSREWMIIWGVAGFASLLAFRILRYSVFKYARKNELNIRRVGLVGTQPFASQIADKIREADWTGLKVSAFFGIEDAGEVTDREQIPNARRLSELPASISSLDLDEIWITLPLSHERILKKILYELRHQTITIRYVPQLSDLPLLNQSVSEFAGIPVLNLSETPMRGFNLIAKNIEDVVLSSLILVLISPLMLVIALGIKLTSPGPILYRQQRMGWNGKPFDMLKFRSMPVDAESCSGPVWATPDHNRATRFGAFLRRTSLDELPQFLNVLRGDMSIVGPRPERPVFVEKFKDEIPGYMKKHMVKAGITGWAQINGWRGNTDLSKRIECDLFYIENWSLWFDVKIIFLSVFKGFKHVNAY
jgi:putative colanic acid biosynthesis UDP-glucose lipid carrier transferase